MASIVDTFQAAPGHGIVPGDELILLDTAANRSLQSQCLATAGDLITIDRPVDHNFAAATTLGRITNTNMAVDGSVNRQAFVIRAGAVPSDIVRFIVTLTSGGSMDDGKFGDQPPLTRGLVLRIVNGYQRAIFNFKTNGEIKQFCYDGTYTSSTLGPAGQESFAARITFGGQSKHGVVLRIGPGDIIQWIVQDDLTGLGVARVSAMGHDTVGEAV
jgi:hypothetical protein